MVLAECGAGVTIVAKHLGDGGRGLRDNAGVAVPVVGQFGDLAKADAVVVAAGHQGGPGGRAHGHGMEGIVGDALLGQARQGRGLYLAAESTRLTEAGIVEHHDKNIGRVLRQVAGLLAPLVNRFLHGRPDLAAHGRGGKGKDVLGGHARR